MSADAPAVDLDDRHGFIHAKCEKCGKPDVWLTCNTCKKSDRFRVDGTTIVCHCGATYAFATCTCGQTVPRERLEWVAFDKGPLALADWEIDKTRVAVLGTIGVAVLGLGAIAIWSFVT